jgi:hypothetical protein
MATSSQRGVTLFVRHSPIPGRPWRRRSILSSNWAVANGLPEFGSACEWPFTRGLLRNGTVITSGPCRIGVADYPAATALIDEEMRLAEEVGDRDIAAFALVNLGDLALARDDRADAYGRFEQAVAMARATGSIELLGNTLTVTISGLLAVDEVDRAEKYVDELRALGPNANAPGRHVVMSGMVMARRGEVEEGLSMMREGIANFRAIRGYANLAGVLRGLFDEWAGIESARGAAERAATLLGGADQLVRGAKRLPYEQVAADLRRRAIEDAMSAEVFHRAWQKGMNFSVDELLDFAIDT